MHLWTVWVIKKVTVQLLSVIWFMFTEFSSRAKTTAEMVEGMLLS